MQAAASAAMLGGVAILMALYYVVMVAVTVIQYVALWKIFAKAGEPGWKCLIPLYNGHTLYKLVWKPVYYWLTVISTFVVLTLVSVWSIVAGASEELPVVLTAVMGGVYLVWAIVAITWAVKMNIKLARCFGHGGAFAAGLIFVPVVFLLILAFGKDAYLGNPPVQKQPEPQSQEPWNP